MKIAILRRAYLPDLQNIQAPIIYFEDYETVADAQNQIRTWDDEVYVTQHGEASRPTYVIVSNNVADYVSNGRWNDASNYDWVGAECECGECGKCIAWMIGQDHEYLLRNAEYCS